MTVGITQITTLISLKVPCSLDGTQSHLIVHRQSGRVSPINSECTAAYSTHNPGWIYLLYACHESISVSNLGRRQRTRWPSPVLNHQLVWMRLTMEIGFGSAVNLLSYLPGSDPPHLFLISVRHRFTSRLLSSSVRLLHRSSPPSPMLTFYTAHGFLSDVKTASAYW